MADEARCNRGLQTTTIDQSLLSWGANNYGQLGLKHTDDELVPSHATIVSPIWTTADDTRLNYVGGGGGFSYALTGKGKLFTCGNNDRGQVGRGNRENISVFSPVTHLTNYIIHKIAAGWDFMLSITDTGQVFSWGSNSFGQLGRPLGQGIGFDTVPGKINFPHEEKQIDVAAGLRHALSLSGNGKVFSWGSGKKGQLGSVDEGKKPVLKSTHPLPVALPNGQTVVQIVAGMYHSSLLIAPGHIFVWGCNKYGQCGQDPQSLQSQPFPHKVNLSCKDAGLHFSQLASGWTHLVAKTVSGNLYSWGRGDLGQLGRPCHTSFDHVPREVVRLSNVKMHSCGSEHNLALTEEGKLYAWGWNEHGICGTSGEENVSQPTLVPSLKNENVIDIGCGAGHSFCIVANIESSLRPP